MQATTKAPTAKPAADIHSRAMLVRLSVSCWDGRRFDKKITDEVNNSHAASKDAGRYNKQLLGGKKNAPSHADAVSAGGNARQRFYKETLPWTDEGWRLLPTANYEKFTDAMRKMRTEFEGSVETFLAEYPSLKEAARALLNGMYREEDYPTVEALRGKFRFSIEFSPVPSQGDFRLDLPADQLEEIERGTASRVEQATKAAMEDAWGRLREVVGKVRERLTGVQTEGKKKGQPKIFRDSLIENVAELADVLSRLNVTDDPDLEAMRQRVENELADLEPKKLREDSKARTKAAKSADDILRAMEGLYGGGQ
jgi:hypothetical protein